MRFIFLSAFGGLGIQHVYEITVTVTFQKVFELNISNKRLFAVDVLLSVSIFNVRNCFSIKKTM